MSLDSFLNDQIEEQEEKLPEDGYCPSCEKKGEITRHWYIRCTNGDCEVITFIP